MILRSTRQLQNAREKLRILEGRLGGLDSEPPANPRTRDLTRRSLRKLVKQLKEEIIRFESDASAGSHEV